MCLVSSFLISLSLFGLLPGYRANRDDRNSHLFLSTDVNHRSIELEQEAFRRSGACTAENGSQIELCSPDDFQPVHRVVDFFSKSCACDHQCEEYGDCCINRTPVSKQIPNWSCREVRGEDYSKLPIYVYQQCPVDYKDEFVREMCEVEATTRVLEGLPFDHLQDMPVVSIASRRWYRNVYCAMCNDDTQLVKWSSYIFCNGDTDVRQNHLDEDLDFGNAVYEPRLMKFRKVKVGDKLRNCQIIVRDFNLKRIFTYGARLCKPVVTRCPEGAPRDYEENCQSYTSYVYSPVTGASRRKVFKNFHCALCHGIQPENLKCSDPYLVPIVFTGYDPSRSTLTLLFDFNFRGGLEEVGSRSPCLLSKGQVWDPILKKCQNYTCGSLFKKVGTKCVPIGTFVNGSGLESDCIKIILDKSSFHLLPNKSAYINESKKILAEMEYEVYNTANGDVLQILICLDVDSRLLPYSKAHNWLSVITLSISIICLILHLTIYLLLKKLRNCPGKVLMSLSASLLCGHLFLLLGPHFTKIFWLCYLNGVATHFGYLCAFSWMTIMAVDIHRTFSVTQSRQRNKATLFLRYSMQAWLLSLVIVALSIILDNFLPKSSDFRPRYGDPICWFNHRKGLLLYFVLPAVLMLLANLVLFVITAVHIAKVSRQTRMVNNFSDKVRYFLYLKLSVVLGLTWILGLVAGVAKMDALWYPFIILNGLQGALIFVAFTVKRSVFKMLAVKLRIRSDKYRLRKARGIKATMYSSLSNLTTLSTTLASQLPVAANSSEMLKAVRKLNSDAVEQLH